jgi:hypothetical protein
MIATCISFYSFPRIPLIASAFTPIFFMADYPGSGFSGNCGGFILGAIIYDYHFVNVFFGCGDHLRDIFGGVIAENGGNHFEFSHPGGLICWGPG